MLRTVRLELARCRDFPEGSPTHGYELRIPLDARGKLDVGEMPAHRHETTFRRFWGGEDETGRVHHDHRGWKLAFSGGPEEIIFKGDVHRFLPGDYVSIAERDGETRTFRVITVL